MLAYPDIASLIYPELLRAFQSHLLHDIELVEPPETPRICRDPDDDKVIAAAIYGLADFILTVDKDLVAPEVAAILKQMGTAITTGTSLIHKLDTSTSE